MATTRTGPSFGWRTPAVILVCGCLISILTFGPRSTFGFFLQPMSQELGWGRDVFALAVAIQNLLYGVGLPFAGAIADRFGTLRALDRSAALLYAAGLVLMAYATTPGMLHLSAGVLIGFGLAGASFPIVLAAFGKLLPESLALVRVRSRHRGRIVRSVPVLAARRRAAGRDRLASDAAGLRRHRAAGAAARVRDLARHRWQAVPRRRSRNRSVEALGEAFGHGSYVLLILGFFTCGFHVAFITMHLPPYLVDKGLDAKWGGWVIALHRPVQHHRLDYGRRARRAGCPSATSSR